MMLTTDLCMAFRNNHEYIECLRNTKGIKRERKKICEPKFKLGTDLDPKAYDCCTWACTSRMFKKRDGAFTEGQDNEFCGKTVQHPYHRKQ